MGKSIFMIWAKQGVFNGKLQTVLLYSPYLLTWEHRILPPNFHDVIFIGLLFLGYWKHIIHCSKWNETRRFVIHLNRYHRFDSLTCDLVYPKFGFVLTSIVESILYFVGIINSKYWKAIWSPRDQIYLKWPSLFSIHLEILAKCLFICFFPSGIAKLQENGHCIYYSLGPCFNWEVM